MDADVAIYDILGLKVAEAFSGELNPRQHLINWNGTDSRSHVVSSEVYFFRFESNPGILLIRKLTLLR